MSTESSKWRSFFDSHAPHYDENGFTAHTVAEVDFLLSLFPLTPGMRLLDMGCGTGRHSIELARRGFLVTGVDLSAGMLDVAKRKAEDAKVLIEWVQADGTKWKADRLYDGAICLCEGGIGLLDPGQNAELHDLEMLEAIAEALKGNAPFLMTTLNGYSVIRQMKDEHSAEGRFNPANMYATYQDEWDLPEGTRIVDVHERLFIAPEMVKLLQTAGFIVDNVYGGTAGHWGRRFLSLDEIEAMFVCRKG